MLSYMNLFDNNDNNDNIEENDESWNLSNQTLLLPSELELESRLLETKDDEVLEAKKIIDKYIILKKQLKEYKKDYNECEEIYENYLTKKKELSTAILNFTNSVSNIQTLISSIDFNNQLNNLKDNKTNENNNNIDKNLLNNSDKNFKHTKELIDYLVDVNYKINNGDLLFLEKINNENSRLYKKLKNIQDQMKIIRNLILLCIKETSIDNQEKDLKVDSKTCPICFENDVSYCLNPCGHLICKECSKIINNSCRCPTCRTIYNTKIKIYFNV